MVCTIEVDLAYADLSCYYDYVANAINFVVDGGNTAEGIVNLRVNVSFWDVGKGATRSESGNRPSLF